MRVDVEHVLKIMDEWRRLNSLDPKDVELYENGVKLKVSEKVIEEWKFVGLGFMGFIETEAYKEEDTEFMK